jgi:hypothetical protein
MSLLGPFAVEIVLLYEDSRAKHFEILQDQVFIRQKIDTFDNALSLLQKEVGIYESRPTSCYRGSVIKIDGDKRALAFVVTSPRQIPKLDMTPIDVTDIVYP